MKPPSGKINPDLARERGKASFDTRELTYLLYGGRERTERKKFLGNWGERGKHISIERDQMRNGVFALKSTLQFEKCHANRDPCKVDLKPDTLE